MHEPFGSMADGSMQPLNLPALVVGWVSVRTVGGYGTARTRVDEGTDA